MFKIHFGKHLIINQIQFIMTESISIFPKGQSDSVYLDQDSILFKMSLYRWERNLFHISLYDQTFRIMGVPIKISLALRSILDHSIMGVPTRYLKADFSCFVIGLSHRIMGVPTKYLKADFLALWSVFQLSDNGCPKKILKADFHLAFFIDLSIFR